MIRRLIRRLARDERGISAVEFALLAPVLIAFYLGMSEFCQGYMAQKRMGHAASAVADLVAQEDVITRTELDDIFDIGALIMKPFSASTLKQRVSGVTRTGNKVKVDWSRGDGLTALTKDSEITIPADLLSDGESLIVAEATYDYDSPADYLMPGLTRFRHIYYLRPRISDKVVCSNC